MNVVAKQLECPSGQYLADFATMPSAVKVARAQWNGQHAFVVKNEEMYARGKNSEGLD